MSPFARLRPLLPQETLEAGKRGGVRYWTIEREIQGQIQDTDSDRAGDVETSAQFDLK